MKTNRSCELIFPPGYIEIPTPLLSYEFYNAPRPRREEPRASKILDLDFSCTGIDGTPETDDEEDVDEQQARNVKDRLTPPPPSDTDSQAALVSA